MILNRRQFVASATALTMDSVRWAKAAAPVAEPLVIIFLRGGMDAMNFIAPADDRDYAAARPPQLRVSLTGAARGLAIGGMEGGGDLLLHPQAEGLAQIYGKGRLAFIPAAGMKHATRSHFQAMDFLERGLADDGRSLPQDGWLTRAALAMGRKEAGSTIAIGGALPQSLSLCESAMAAGDVWDIDWTPSPLFKTALLAMHSGDSALDLASRQAIAATGQLALKLDRSTGQEPVLRDPPRGVRYPDHDFGRKLHFLAEMMRLSPDICFATADLDGWDTHERQMDWFPRLVQTLSQSMAALDNHLDAIGRPATVVVQSEFGRRLKANDSGGTDHGHGGVMMVMGPHIAGGRNFGRWPGLAAEQLDERMDLAVTTDFRDVLGTVLRDEKVADAAFPGHRVQRVDGLMRG